MTSRRSLVTFAGTLVLGTLVLAGCGDDDVTESSDVTETSTGEDDVSETSDATVVPSDVTDTSTGEDDEIDLDAILLRIDDLPDGWRDLTVGSDEGGSCLDALFGADKPLDPQVAATATFGASDNGPFLVAWVVGEPRNNVLAEANDVLVACDGTTAASGFTTTIDPTPVPGLPDNSLSVHGADVNASGSRIDFTLAGAGSDRATVVVFAATPLGEIEDALIASAVTAMVGRIPPS